MSVKILVDDSHSLPQPQQHALFQISRSVLEVCFSLFLDAVSNTARVLVSTLVIFTNIKKNSQSKSKLHPTNLSHYKKNAFVT